MASARQVLDGRGRLRTSVRGMMKESIEANAKLFLARETFPTTGILPACASTTWAGWQSRTISSITADELNRLTPQDVTDVLVNARRGRVCRQGKALRLAA